MKITCKVCKETFNYPIEQMNHRHKEIEMDLVPPNFWEIKDYSSEFGITLNSKELILPEVRVKSKYAAGNTPLIHYAPNIFLKDESVNPTGSFKDRGMENLMNEILMHQKEKISVVSCGNGAIATILYAKEFGIKSLVFISKDVSKESLNLIKDADEVHYSDNFVKSYEDFMSYSLEHTDVFCGFINTNISYMLGLRTIAYEIVRDLGRVPDVVIIPCGSGMNVLAQNLAFREMYEAGVIPKIPKIGVVEILGGNPIRIGFESNVDEFLYVIDDPINSKTILSNDTCFNYNKIYNMAKRGEAFFISVSDAQIDKFIADQPEFNVRYDYTSISAMAAIERYTKSHNDETVVAVITCKNRNGGMKK